MEQSEEKLSSTLVLTLKKGLFKKEDRMKSLLSWMLDSVDFQVPTFRKPVGPVFKGQVIYSWAA